MRCVVGYGIVLALVAGCTPSHHTYPAYYESPVAERYLLETQYDRYWEQNHSEGFGFRIDLQRIVKASSTGSERSR